MPSLRIGVGPARDALGEDGAFKVRVDRRRSGHQHTFRKRASGPRLGPVVDTAYSGCSGRGRVGFYGRRDWEARASARTCLSEAAVGAWFFRGHRSWRPGPGPNLSWGVASSCERERSAYLLPGIPRVGASSRMWLSRFARRAGAADNAAGRSRGTRSCVKTVNLCSRTPVLSATGVRTQRVERHDVWW